MLDVSAKPESDEPTIKLTGFFHLDNLFFDQDFASRQTLGDIDDGLGFRRARLAAKGNVTQQTSYILEFDFAQNQARFVDVWMQLEETQLGNIRIGRFRQPFGMSELTSIRTLPFLERSLGFALSPFRQTGIMISDHSEDDRRTWAMSGYRYLSDNFGNVFADADGYGMATRLTAIPIEWNDERLLHAGVGYSYNAPGRGVVQFAGSNELFVGQNPNLGPAGLSVLPLVGVPPFVNTGPIAADGVQFFNVESAMAMGQAAIQAEARWVQVEQTTGATATFPSAYVQFRYVLTGEKIPFLKKEGVFGRVVPTCNVVEDHSWGAWELAGRISHIDLNDGGITGRRLTDYTLGCNWYWNKYTKFQLNWIHSSLNDVNFGDSSTNAIGMRAQLDF